MKTLYELVQPYRELSLEAIQALESITSAISVARNGVLQPIGHVHHSIYFIRQGLVRMHYFHDGEDITESFALDGQLVARFESIFSSKPCRKAIQAVEDTELYVIQMEPLRDLFEIHPELGNWFRSVIEKAHVEMVLRIEKAQFDTPEDRYRDLLENASELVKRVPLKFIASYLGITQAHLSRIRGHV